MQFKIFFRYLVLSALLFPFTGYGQGLEKGFSKPPVSARAKAFWVLINGNYSLSKMSEELEEYKAKGMGGIDIWDVAGWVDPNGVIPAGPAFMGDKSLQAIAHGIREAKRLNLEAGLITASSWNAGGDWVRPEDGVMGLFMSHKKIKGPAVVNQVLDFPIIPDTYKNGTPMLLKKNAQGLPTFFEDVAVLAYEKKGNTEIIAQTSIIDLSSKFSEGVLKWDVPKGEWHIVRYVATGTGQPVMRPSPNSNGLMIDHFSAEAQQRHLMFFFEKLEGELGDLSKSGLDYLYNDSYEANSSNWTRAMPDEFKKKIGYDLVPYLPVLEGKVVGNAEISERFLFDFNKTLSDLIIENHYTLGKKVCNDKGLDFIAEAGGPGPPLHNVPFESLKALGSLTVPRGEFWFDTLQTDGFIDTLQIVKGPASAAHLYGRPWVEAEAFTGTLLWQFGPGALKPSADRALCDGLTRFVYHTAPHVPPEAGKPGWVYNFGTLINTSRVWWSKSANFHEYIARSSFMLQQGNFVGDVLYYYGDGAPNFVDPLRVEAALGFGFDYDFTNSDIILNHLDVKDGYFVLPHGQKYKVLVLPDSEAMDIEVLEKLGDLVQKGGTLSGNPPIRTHGLLNYAENNRAIRALAKKIWGKGRKSSFGKGMVYSGKYDIVDVLNSQNILADVSTNLDDPEDKLDFIHRATETEDIYFVRNKTNSELAFDCTVRSTRGAPEVWNQVTGARTVQRIFVKNDETTTFPLILQPKGSTFIVFRNTKIDNQIVGIAQNGKKVFPGTTKDFNVTVNNGQWVFSKPGAYQFFSVNGNAKTVRVASIEKRLDVTGPWEVRFPFGWGAPQRTIFEELISWPDSDNVGIKHFSGIAAYHKTFSLKKNQVASDMSLTLDLGKVCEVADVYLNGRHLDVLWHAPYEMDISDAVREGENHLVIEVANTWRNQLIYDAHREEGEKRTHTNITKGPNAWQTPLEKLSLIPSGLIGPVKIIFKKRKRFDAVSNPY